MATTTTAQKLVRAQEKQQAIATREAEIARELAEIKKQQEANRQEIEQLEQRQQIISANVEALAALDSDLFDEIMAIATKTRQPAPKATSKNVEEARKKLSQQSHEEQSHEDRIANIPKHLINSLKEILEPYCLEVEIPEKSRNQVFLHDYDDPSISPGALFWENDRFNPSQEFLSWLRLQGTSWEELKMEIEQAIEGKTTTVQATKENPAEETEPDVFETPYKQLMNNTFILIDPDNPTQGKVKIAQDMPRAYNVIRQGAEMILEITTSSGISTVRSSWDWNTRYPKKYQPATRAILKHYVEVPELLAAFNEQYPEISDLIAEAEQAKKDLFPEQYPLGYSEDNPVGAGVSPSFEMKMKRA